MKRVHDLTLAMTVAAGLFIGCGDDDSPADGGGDADHGDHGHEGDDHDKKDSGPSASDDGGSDDDDAGTKPALSFFVTSDTSKTGNLGGLTGADTRCNTLAKAAGAKAKFAAYLSAEKNEKGEDKPVDARDRIGKGPWYNAKGVLLAKDVEALHKLPSGNADLFLTEKGGKINGQWEGSPTPNEHDVLTGSDAEGKLRAGFTCLSWTSEAMSDLAQVGHSDGLGPMRSPAPPYNSWNSSHENGGCNDTAPKGGAGHIYCFAVE
jgi:hypothetical protein